MIETIHVLYKKYMRRDNLIINSGKIKRVLILNLGGMGDLLLASPYFRELRKNLPNSKIFLLGIKRSVSILENNSNIDTIVTIDDIYINKIDKLRELLDTLLKLRNEKIDLLINTLPIARLGGTVKLFTLINIIKPKIKIGLNTENRGFFYDLSIYETDNHKFNAIDNYLQLAKLTGGKTDIRELDLFIDKKYDDSLNKIIDLSKFNDKKLIGINPGATLQTRRWPKERFVELLKKLSNLYENSHFILTGMKKEFELSEEIIKKSNILKDRTSNLCGKTKIMEFASLLKKMDVFITNDTGSMHVAAATNTPLVAIFGPGDRKRFSPVSKSGMVKIIVKETPCSPCILEYCKDLSCLKKIESDDVLEGVKKLMNNELIRYE